MIHPRISSATIYGGVLENRSDRHGFTLVELIVVVGALVFLIAMLIPAMLKAQRQSRTMICLENVHQLELGYKTYTDQNGALRLASSEKTFWLEALRPSLPDVGGILLCPEASTPSYGFGSDTLAWGPYNSSRGSPSISIVGANYSSYGFNGWLYASTTSKQPGRATEFAANTVVFADAAWFEGWPRAGEPTPADATGREAAKETGLTRFYIARHGRSVNAAFLDGHAEQVPLDELSTKSWSNGEPRQLNQVPSR